jgi:hypothetical protein
MPAVTLHNWIHRGWVKARREGVEWIWADESELSRLRERRERSHGYYTRQRWIQTQECGQASLPATSSEVKTTKTD